MSCAGGADSTAGEIAGGGTDMPEQPHLAEGSSPFFELAGARRTLLKKLLEDAELSKVTHSPS